MKKSLRKVFSLLCVFVIMQSILFSSAFFISGESGTSGETGADAGAAAQTGTGLSVPEITYAVASTTSVSLTWVTVPDATGYDLDADGNVISNLQTTSYTHSGLAPNTAHQYKVRAKNAEITGEWGETVSITTAKEKAPQAKLQMYNLNRMDSINSVYPRFKLINTGTEPINLSDVKIRYYYKIEGIESQNFWCDWSSVGREKVTGTFARLPAPKDGADYYLEVGFVENAGYVQAGESVEIQTRFANTDWSSYIQSNDYSFNSSATDYADWKKAAVYVAGTPVWGEEPSVDVPAPDKVAAVLQMYNSKRTDSTNSISPYFKLTNTGTSPLKLSDTKIKYYYKIEGIESQNFWCDWSNIGAANITGSFARLSAPKEGADYCLEIGFTGSAGSLLPGQSAQIQARFANTEWSNYTQSNDYSFNSAATDYTDWKKAMVYIAGTAVWGQEPSVDVPALDEQAAKLQMYNGNRSATTNTVYPRYKLYNTGSKAIDLKDIKIRYYYTSDGTVEQNFWCDWTPVGSGNVTGKFIKVPEPAANADYCFETSFTSSAGKLMPGAGLEIQLRFAKANWSSYSQTNDYSFNSSATGYADWSKASVYIGGELVWGNELMLGIPNNITASATETETTLAWKAVPGATGYEVEADGVRIDAGSSTSYTHGGLNPGTLHRYRVRAKNSDNAGSWSGSVEKWTLPAIPGNVVVSSAVNSIIVTWDEVTGATGYDIEVYGTAIDNGTKTTYTHTGLNPNLQQTYRVRAKNSSGAGKWSALSAGSTLPGIPANLNAAAAEKSVLLKWDSVSGATGYDVEADGVLVPDVASNLYRHEGLTPNTPHTYKVRAKNENGAGSWSQPLSATTLLPVPAGITADLKSTEIVLQWEKVDLAAGYEVEADGIIKNCGSETAFKHAGLAPGSSHTYRVRAVNGSNTSAWSKEISAITLSGIPINIIATASNNAITIKWDPIDGVEGYDIEVDGRVINNGTKTTYIHTGLAANSEHTYRVRARNSAGAGEWSEMITIATSIIAPEGFKATATSTTVVLNWNAVKGASGYDLLLDGIITDTGVQTAYEHKNLEPNSVHVYRVRTRKGDATSAWSGALVQKTMVGVPSGFKGTSKTNEIKVSWNKVEDATLYELEADGKVKEVGDKTSYTHMGLELGTSHSYRVRAGNSGGMGDWSEILVKKTAPPAPQNLKAEPVTNEVKLTWDACTGAVGYELEVNGTVAKNIKETGYVHTGLEPNTMQAYRVKALYEDGESDWSEMLKAATKPQLILKIAENTIFNFVVIVPAKKDVDTRVIRVEYNADELEVADLCANTPGIDKEAGAIEGTSINVTVFEPGKIVYEIANANKTVVNMIRFLSKTNENSKVSYTIE